MLFNVALLTLRIFPRRESVLVRNLPQLDRTSKLVPLFLTYPRTARRSSLLARAEVVSRVLQLDVERWSVGIIERQTCASERAQKTLHNMQRRDGKVVQFYTCAATCAGLILWPCPDTSTAPRFFRALAVCDIIIRSTSTWTAELRAGDAVLSCIGETYAPPLCDATAKCTCAKRNTRAADGERSFCLDHFHRKYSLL